MTCDEARAAMDAFLDGELKPAEEEAHRGHLASCAACAREVEERRAFSASLCDSFDRALEDVGSAPAERHALVERMHAAARRRALFPARLAAAAMVGLAVGIAAYASGLIGPRPESPERRAVADIACEEAARYGQIDLLRREAVLDLQKAREIAGRGGENPAVRLASLQVSSLEELLAPEPAARRTVADLVADTAGPDWAVRGAARKALRQLPPSRLDELRRAAAETADCDRAYVGQVVTEIEDRSRPAAAGMIVIAQSDNGTTVEFKQHRDGRVELAVPGLKAEARSVHDLLSRHPDVCRRYGIAGREGAVIVGGRAASVDLGAQVNLMFRTGAWNEGVQWDAYRAWITGRVPDAAEVEKKVKGLQERYLQAAQPPPMPEVQVDVQAIIQGVHKMTEEQLRQTRERVEQRMKDLQARLREAQELRARARSLRVYAETVGSEK
jgi:hypothetical protein